MSPPPAAPTSSSNHSSSSTSDTNLNLPPITSSPAVAASSSNMFNFNYLLIPLLIALSKDLTAASASASASAPNRDNLDGSNLLLPSQNLSVFHEPRLGPGCPAVDAKLNYRPIIGILTHPGDGASGRLNNATNASYIAASYVKFVESAGARVIPLIYNEPPENLYKKLNLVNGVLFTGGWAKSGLYFDMVGAVLKEEVSSKIIDEKLKNLVPQKRIAELDVTIIQEVCAEVPTTTVVKSAEAVA